MLALRYAAVLALTIWVGGLVVLGSIAAPTIFDVLGAHGIADRVGGAVFGEMLQRAHTVGYVCGALLLISLVARRILGPRPVHVGIRFVLASVMLVAMLYSGLVVSTRIQSLQQAIGTSPSELGEQDPRRLEFNRLHATSTALVMVPILGGLALLFFELKD